MRIGTSIQRNEQQHRKLTQVARSRALPVGRLFRAKLTILENLSTHKTKLVQDFLSDHPNVRLHFTPTYSSWLNQVELWFARIE